MDPKLSGVKREKTTETNGDSPEANRAEPLKKKKRKAQLDFYAVSRQDEDAREFIEQSSNY